MGIPFFLRAPVLNQRAFIDFYTSIGRLEEVKLYSDMLSSRLISADATVLPRVNYDANYAAKVGSAMSCYAAWSHAMEHDDIECFEDILNANEKLKQFMVNHFNPCIAAWALQERGLGERQETDMVFNHFNLSKAVIILDHFDVDFKADWELLKAKANLQKAIIAVSEAVGRNIQTTWGSIDIQSAWKALKDDEKLQQAVIALHDAGVDLSAREPSCGGNLWNSLSDWRKLVTNKQLQQTVINFSSIPADNLPYVSITDFSYHQIFKRYAAMLALSRGLGRALSSEESEMVDDDLISEISALADGVADYTGQLTPNNFLMSSSVCSILLGHVMSEDSLRTEEDKAVFHIHKLFKPLICNCDNETDRKALIDCRNKVLQETQRFCMARDLQGENAYIPPTTREMDRSLDFSTFDAKISSYASECESKLGSSLSKFKLMWNNLKFNLCKIFGVTPKASNPYKIATQMFSATDNIKHCHFNEESSAMRSIG